MSSGPSPWVTAAFCGGLRPSRRAVIGSSAGAAAMPSEDRPGSGGPGGVREAAPHHPIGLPSNLAYQPFVATSRPLADFLQIAMKSHTPGADGSAHGAPPLPPSPPPHDRRRPPLDDRLADYHVHLEGRR